jgi:hypothetical protein
MDINCTRGCQREALQSTLLIPRGKQIQASMLGVHNVPKIMVIGQSNGSFFLNKKRIVGAPITN